MTEIPQRQHLFYKAEEMPVLTGTLKIPSFFSFKLTILGPILLTLKKPVPLSPACFNLFSPYRCLRKQIVVQVKNVLSYRYAKS